MRRSLVIPALLLMAGPLAACNQGSGDFCGDLGATLKEISAVPANASAAELEAYYERLGEGLDDMDSSAPSDLEDEVAVVKKAYAQVTKDLRAVDFDTSNYDNKPFGTAEFSKAANALDEYAREECDIDAPTTTTGSDAESDDESDDETTSTTTAGDEGTSSTIPEDETAPSTSTPPA